MIRVAVTGGDGADGLFAAGDIGPACEFAGILMSADWDAADITVQASFDGVTYQNCVDDGGTALAFAVGASRVVALRTPARFEISRFRFFRLRSGTAGVPVAQSAERTLYLLAFEQER